MGLNLTSADPIITTIPHIVPIIVFLLGTGVMGTIIGILLENKIKKLNSLEDKLRKDRSKIYFNLLIPFVKLFNKETNQEAAKNSQEAAKNSQEAAKNSQEAAKNSQEAAIAYLSSEEYRRTSFEVTLIGSDDVVKAYGDLMQEAFKQGREPKKPNEIKKPNEMIILLGDLLLQLRKDLEHKDTKLTRKDMLRHMITDIDEYDL